MLQTYVPRGLADLERFLPDPSNPPAFSNTPPGEFHTQIFRFVPARMAGLAF